MIRCQEAKFEINSLKDLIALSELSQTSEKLNNDIKKLYEIRKELKKLDNMIGLKDLKQQIVYQIMFFIQKLNSDEMMHSVLMGPPGVGKTTVAKILAFIYTKLGFLSKGNLVIVNREDLVGQYLGETAVKTRSVLEKNKGNVLFIDEAYSLGNGNKSDSDSYAKECVDTLTAFLSENTKDFICIIAGYEDELKKCFFAGNPGLDRRFPWKYILPTYKNDELYNIFISMLKQKKWKIRAAFTNDISENLQKLFNEHNKYFCNNGGDIQIFINCCMMAHSKRIFGDTRKFKKHLITKDIMNGFRLFKANKKGIVEESNISKLMMYT